MKNNLFNPNGNINLKLKFFLNKMIAEMIAIFSAIILLKQEKDSELG